MFPSVLDFGGTRTKAAEMRRQILERLDYNYLVGFYLTWTLTALSLALPASAIIDLGTDELYQKWCISMAFNLPHWNLLISEAIINYLDCQTFAVLFCKILDVYIKDSDDIY